MSTNRLRTVLGILAAASILPLTGCMDASLSQSGNAPANISIQGAPSTLGDMDLTISGPGMSDINKTVSRDSDSLVLDVPVGPDREFEALRYLNGDTTAFYKALSTASVTPGGAQVTLPIALRSKTIVPEDGEKLHLYDAGSWESRGADDPYDVDFDEFGRIYVANSTDGAVPVGSGSIVRVDTFTGAVTTIYTGDYISVAVDRDNQWIYMLGSAFEDNEGTVFRMRYDGSGQETVVTSSDLPVQSDFGFQLPATGIDVGEDGTLYVSQQDYVSAVDGDTGEVLRSFQYATYGTDASRPNYASADFAADVSVQNGSVYLLLEKTERLGSIVRIDKGLTSILNEYGSSGNTTPTNAGEFGTPRRLLVTLNQRITVADAGVSEVYAVDNLDGDGWTRLPTPPPTPPDSFVLGYADIPNPQEPWGT